MKILASPQTPREAAIVLAAGVDVVDVKNVEEGSLGAATPNAALSICRLAGEQGTPVSVALGDLEHHQALRDSRLLAPPVLAPIM